MCQESGAQFLGIVPPSDGGPADEFIGASTILSAPDLRVARARSSSRKRGREDSSRTAVGAASVSSDAILLVQSATTHHRVVPTRRDARAQASAFAGTLPQPSVVRGANRRPVVPEQPRRSRELCSTPPLVRGSRAQRWSGHRRKILGIGEGPLDFCGGAREAGACTELRLRASGVAGMMRLATEVPLHRIAVAMYGNVA